MGRVNPYPDPPDPKDDKVIAAPKPKPTGPYPEAKK